MQWRYDDMETFVQVVRCGGVTGAANHLTLTKSVISKRIRDFELALGLQLFQRLPGRLEPTEAGEALYDRIAPLLGELHEAVEDMLPTKGDTLRGRLRISTPMSFGILYLGPVIADFGRQHPGLEIAVDYDDRPVSLAQGGYDVAVRIGHFEDSSLKTRTLGECERLICCSPDYAQRRGLPTRVADLAEHDAIDYALVHARRFWQFEGPQGEPVTVAMRSRILANNGEAIRDMAIAGLGIASLPAFLVDEPIRKGLLVALPLELRQRPYTMAALYPNTRHVPAKVRGFIDHLVRMLQLHAPEEAPAGGKNAARKAKPAPVRRPNT
ncbi:MULTISPECIES: LysR family transcriptional regulator [Achromobacter]|nr:MULTISPECIES: LysR family transcriptional regulator [Achromobacter]